MHPQKQAAACLSFAYHSFSPISELRFTHNFCACGQGFPDHTPLWGNGLFNKSHKHTAALIPKL
jgi:hypothetical protein